MRYRSMLRVLAFVAAAMAAPIPAQSEIPVEHFAWHAEFEDIKISPDGSYYAATVPKGDMTVLIMLDRSDLRSGTMIEPGKNEHVYWYEWANPTRVIYKVARKRGGYDFPLHYGEILATDVDGKRRGNIFGYRGSYMQAGSRLRRNTSESAWGTVVDMLPDDPDHVLIAAEPWSERGDAFATLYKLDVNRGITKKTGRLPMRDAWVVTDRNNAPRFASGFVKGYEYEVRHRPRGARDWTMLPALSAIEFGPIGYSEDQSRLFGIGYDDNSVRGLYAYSIDDGTIQPVITGSPFDLSYPLMAPGTNQLLGVFSSAQKFDYHFVDDSHRLTRVYRSLLAAFPGQRVFITSMTRDAGELIVRVDSDRNAGDFYLFDTASNKAKYLLSARAWLDPEALGPVEPIEFAASDGVRIHGYLTWPAAAARNKPLPMVVLPHGGPHGIRDTWAFDGDAQFLASRGYLVLQPNFRGSGGYGRDFLESGYREWGARMQQDVTDATRWAIENGYADPGRICLYGGSYGAYSALMGVATEPALYRCAIGSSGVYDLEMLYTAGDIKDWMPGRGFLEKVVSDNPETLRERSPVHRAADIEAPVFLIHGGRDERAPIAHARAMRAALKKAGNSPKWLVFKQEGHGYYDVGNRTRVLTEIEKFLARHIGS